MRNHTIGVLGLDGLSQEYLSRMVDSGFAPTIKSLVSGGYTYTLRAFEPVPPITSTSWTSILTGVNPGKHGIPGFYDCNGRLITAEDLEHPRVCEILAFNGEESILINPIPDYPVYTISKCHILSHGFFTPKPLCNSEILRKYVSKAPSLNLKYMYYDCRIASTLREFYEYYLYIVEELLDHNRPISPRLFWLNLDFPDHYLHRCPSVLKGARISRDEARIIEIMDKITRKLLDNFDFVVVVSDHGFSFYDKIVYVNSLLKLKGYVKVTYERERAVSLPERVDVSERIFRIGIGYRLYRIIRVLHLRRLVTSIIGLLGRLGVSVRVEKKVFVDRFESKAYMPPKGYMGLVVKDKRLIDEVIRVLRGVEGLLLVKKNTEYAWGPYADRLPDVVVLPDFYRGYIVSEDVAKDVIVEKKSTIWHHPDGVFIIGPSKRLEEANVHPMREHGVIQPYTVTNVILSLLSIPLSHIADGVEEVKSILGGNVGIERKNYITKWRLVKQIKRMGKV